MTLPAPIFASPLEGGNLSGAEHFTPLWLNWFIQLGTGGSSTGGGPNTGAGVPGGYATLPDFTINQTTQAYYINDTNPGSWAAGPGYQEFRADFFTNGYFTANPTGHFAIGLRNAVGAPDPRFAGIACGYLIGTQGAPQWAPMMQVETRNASAAPAGIRFLYEDTATPRGKTPVDGQTYRLMIRSTVTQDGQHLIRYRLLQWVPTQFAWDTINDTGDVVDVNTWIDYTQSGIIVAEVFGSNLVPGWSLNFTNVSVTWGPAQWPEGDQSVLLNKYGPEIYGPMTFRQPGSVISILNNGADLTQWTAFVGEGTNVNTNVLAYPNGTANVAGFLALGGAPGASYQFSKLGMNNGAAQWEIGGVGASPAPPGRILVNGVDVLDITGAGLATLGSSERIGQTSLRLTAPFNWDNGNAVGFSQTANFDMTSICAIGTLASFMNPTPVNTQVENVIRPLYCFFSALVADLKARKII